MILFINTPTSLLEHPKKWSHDLTLELAIERQSGITVLCLDNASYRLNCEVLKAQVKQFNPEKIIIYGGFKQFKFIKEYSEAFPNATIRGIPKRMFKDLPIEDCKVPLEDANELPYPAWDRIPLQNYFQNTLPILMETTISVRRTVYNSRWGENIQNPVTVANNLLYLKIKYNYELMSFEEDFTIHKKRVFSIMENLEDYDLLGTFKWMCRADYSKIDRDLLTAFKDSGCIAIDYGIIDVTESRDPLKMERLHAAITTTKKWGISPTIKCSIGFPDTNREDLVKMLEFLKGNGLDCKPLLIEPYPDTPLYWKIKDQVDDIESHVLRINEGFMNYTKWSDIELLGIVELMGKGDIERLEKIRNPL